MLLGLSRLETSDYFSEEMIAEVLPVDNPLLFSGFTGNPLSVLGAPINYVASVGL